MSEREIDELHTATAFEKNEAMNRYSVYREGLDRITINASSSRIKPVQKNRSSIFNSAILC